MLISEPRIANCQAAIDFVVTGQLQQFSNPAIALLLVEADFFYQRLRKESKFWII
ncbi:MAG: hypothetical protein VKL59_13900 [Nostocaceae cyanobacterium]|nr:hypothetical protein [Nostocaceae cyanobacterium]